MRTVRDRDGKELFHEGTAVDITERKRMQEDIESKSRSLEETNAALRVLLKHREQDNAELEEKVFYNIKELVLPYVEKLKSSHSKDAVIVDIIERNLNDILTPFLRDMASKYVNFTPKEIQIADLIKKGKSHQGDISDTQPLYEDYRHTPLQHKAEALHYQYESQPSIIPSIVRINTPISLKYYLIYIGSI